MENMVDKIKVLEGIVQSMKTIRYGIMDPFYHQTVSEHTMNMVELAPAVLAEIDVSLDADLVMATILVHDLPEMGMEKDITSWELEQNPELEKVKAQIERQKINELGEVYGAWIVDLFDEYEGLNTDMALFIRWLDRYESNIYIFRKFEEGPCKYEWVMEHNAGRLIKATLEFPVMKKIAIRRFEELRPMYEKHEKLDLWYELVGRLV